MEHQKIINEMDTTLSSIEALYAEQIRLYELLRVKLSDKEFVSKHRQEIHNLDRVLEK